jgi:hypothetical protein
MRTLVLIGAGLLLSGCNMVVTSTPLFTKADEDGAAQLKPGVWSGPTDASCTFDERAPLERWPSCANGDVVGDGAIAGYQDNGGKPVLVRSDDILAAGEPRVMQVHASTATLGPGVTVSGYFYLALRPTGTDDHGRIITFTAWPVLCGPPPADTPLTNNKIVLGTKHPLPGMVMDKDGNNCATGSTGALKNAAVASEKWATNDGGSVSASHWVRDGER